MWSIETCGIFRRSTARNRIIARARGASPARDRQLPPRIVGGSAYWIDEYRTAGVAVARIIASEEERA